MLSGVFASLLALRSASLGGADADVVGATGSGTGVGLPPVTAAVHGVSLGIGALYKCLDRFESGRLALGRLRSSNVILYPFLVTRFSFGVLVRQDLSSGLGKRCSFVIGVCISCSGGGFLARPGTALKLGAHRTTLRNSGTHGLSTTCEERTMIIFQLDPYK